MIGLYAKYQQEAGHDVTVITHGGAAFDQPHRTEQIIRNPGFPLGKTGYFYPLWLTAGARHALAQADLIHCHHLFLCIKYGKRFGQAPIVYTNHTRYDLYAAVYTPIRPKRWARPMAARFMCHAWPNQTGLCDAIIAPTADIKEIMIHFGVKQPIHVIPNGIETGRFRRPSHSVTKTDLGFEEDHIIGIYVGRLSVEKNIDQLVDSMIDAVGSQKSIRFLLIGPGPETENIRKKVAATNLSNQIKLLGTIPNQDLPGYYQVADFFVTASRSEVHPLNTARSAGGRTAACGTRPSFTASDRKGRQGRYLCAVESGTIRLDPRRFVKWVWTTPCVRKWRLTCQASRRKSIFIRPIVRRPLYMPN